MNNKLTAAVKTLDIFVLFLFVIYSSALNNNNNLSQPHYSFMQNLIVWPKNNITGFLNIHPIMSRVNAKSKQ